MPEYTTQNTEKELLKKYIAEEVFVTNKEEQIDNFTNPDGWLFDFRRIIMQGEKADLIANIFYEQFKNKYPFQICTLEIGGVPLATSLMLKFYQKGYSNINSFFVRKSRKKSGLMRMFEGVIQEEKDIILVDDTMNTGSSFWRQIVALEEKGYKVKSIWCILRYRDISYYKKFHDRGIEIESLFTLDDFTHLLGPKVRNLETKQPQKNDPFEIEWVFKSNKPTYNLVFQKSQPCLDHEKIYFGADNETLWALNQTDGSVAWKFKLGPATKGKSILSNPAIHKDQLIFGSYDGNIYSINKDTGEKKWMFIQADWIGSSPAVAKDLDIVFVGLEFGLWGRRGGIVALSTVNGKLLWKDEHPSLTHSSPLVIEEHDQVVIGSNDGKIRLYEAETGKKMWEFTTFGGADYHPIKDGGFGNGDIKESFAYDSERDYIIFGSIDGFLYIVDRKTGYLVHHHKCQFGIFSTPYIGLGNVYFTSLDKKVRCLNLDNFSLVFETNLDGTRIFSSPTIIKNKLYVGTNAARLHQINPETGEKEAYLQVSERITNSPVYNRKTDTFFLPTYANEIFCLKEKSEDINNG